MLGQYPLDTLNSAPKIRTHALHQAFKSLADVTFITGTRAQRRGPLKTLLKQDFQHFDCAYLEASTSTSMDLDFRVLYRLKQAGVPLGIFIRDAYQLFGLSKTDLKSRLLGLGWHASQYVYRQTATHLFFPSASLAEYFSFPNKQLLPPACRAALRQNAEKSSARRVLYAGHLNEASGWPLLKAAFEQLHTKHPELRLFAVSPTVLAEIPPWLDLHQGVLSEMQHELHDVFAAVIPRPCTVYNHLAMPVKLMDYLSLGLAVVVTPCTEMAQFVRHEGLGLVSLESPESLAASICELYTQPLQRESLGHKIARKIEQGHRWEHRARTVLNTLLPPDRFTLPPERE